MAEPPTKHHPKITTKAPARQGSWGNPRTWGVAAVLIGALVWAGVGFHRVLSRPPGPAAEPSEVAAREVPRTGEAYPWAEAKGLFEAGRRLLRAGDLSGLRTLEQVARDFPEAPQARQAVLVLAASYRYQTHEPARALATYKRFVRDYPDDAQVGRAVEAIRQLAEELNLTDPTTSLLREGIKKVGAETAAGVRLRELLDAAK